MDIVASDVRMSTSYAKNVLYFTGGLSAFETTDGRLALGPVRGTGELEFIAGLRFPEAVEVARQCGSYFVGFNQVRVGTGTPVAVWYPAIGRVRDDLYAADLWSAIAGVAEQQKDADYAHLAESITSSLRAAANGLRDLAVHHNEQLQWALAENRRTGSAFSNLPLTDIHREFHAVVSDLCAARDFLASLAAMHLGLKSTVDSLARLEGKIGAKKANEDQIARALFEASGTEKAPGWLRSLGDLRNKLIHRRPMALDPDAVLLRLQSHNTRHGVVETIGVSGFGKTAPDQPQLPDPFVTLVRHYGQCEHLFAKATYGSKYQPEIPRVHFGSG